MRYPRILAAIRSAKWAVQPATLQAISDTLSARLIMESEGSFKAPVIHSRVYSASAGQGKIIVPQTSLVPVFGIIGKRLSDLEMCCGGCDIDTVEAAISQAMSDASVKSIVLHFDSPGGTVTGVPELAAKIRAWGAVKPIFGFTDTMCASAAYWLASACTAFFCTPTAEVGSIGVYVAILDESQAFQNQGYKLVLIKAGTRKAEGIAGLPILPTAIAAWQSEVDAIYAMFTSDVRSARPKVAVAAMQGQCFMGEAAERAGLVDDVATGLDDVQGLVSMVGAGLMEIKTASAIADSRTQTTAQSKPAVAVPAMDSSHGDAIDRVAARMRARNPRLFSS